MKKDRGVMKKPDYIVIGSPKCATTSLCTCLGRHPNVFMVEAKEIHFFSYDEVYLNKGWKWYQSLFEEGGNKSIIGEGTTDYSMHEIYPNSVHRIAKDLPNVKLIYIVRHPFRRIESLWKHLRSITWDRGWGYISPNFNKAVKQRPHVFVTPSNYLNQLQHYRKYFSDDQILVLFFEDFVKNPDQELKKCFEFIGADSNVTIPGSNEKMNSSEDLLLINPLLDYIRSIPGFHSIMKFFPKNWKDPVIERFFYMKNNNHQWEKETKHWVREQLKEDTIKFLKRYKKLSDFWILE